MNNLKRLFTEHPNDVGETWAQHLVGAWTIALCVAPILLVSLIHGIFPFFFRDTASTMICRLSDDVQERLQSRKSKDTQTTQSQPLYLSTPTKLKWDAKTDT